MNMDAKAIGYAIRRRRMELGLTQTKLAELVGYDGQSTVSRIEHGNQDVPADMLAKIAEVLQTRVSRLWLEAEEQVLHGDLPRDFSVREPEVPYVRRVPVVSWVQAGLPTEAFDPYARGAAERWVTTGAKVGRRAYALEVRGDSMVSARGEPTFPERTVIIVDPERVPENGSLVIVRFEGVTEATFKRLSVDDGRRLLIPLNPQYPTREIDEDAVLCGVVVSKAEQTLGV